MDIACTVIGRSKLLNGKTNATGDMEPTNYNILRFLSDECQFLFVKFSIYLNKHVFIMEITEEVRNHAALQTH